MTSANSTSCTVLGLAFLVVALATLPADGLAQEVETTTGHNVADCPFELLARAYSDLIDTTPDVLDVFALEQEILLLCQERQQLLLIIAQNDARLQLLMNIEADINPGPAYTLPQEECIQPEDNQDGAPPATPESRLEPIDPPNGFAGPTLVRGRTFSCGIHRGSNRYPVRSDRQQPGRLPAT